VTATTSTSFYRLSLLFLLIYSTDFDTATAMVVRHSDASIRASSHDIRLFVSFHECAWACEAVEK
jgi:hypothetical protein